MSLKLITPPAVEPVSLDDVYTHSRIDDLVQDSAIAIYISAARRHAEMITRRAFISQQWLLALDQFPRPGMNISSANWYGPQWGISPGPLTSTMPNGVTGYEIYLPTPPLITVDSIKYVDATTGTLTTLDPSQYLVDSISEPARITPAYGTTWPTTQNQANAVQVTFTCGYGEAATNVPEGIRHWMLLRVGTMYENREEVALLNRGKIELLPFVDTLLDSYRVVGF